MKARAKELGLSDIRVNNAGCLERCELGPSMVIYPEGIWYHFNSTEDIDEILQFHLLNDEPVKRLMLRDGQKYPEHPSCKRLNLVVTGVHPLGKDIIRLEFAHHDDGLLPEFSGGSHLDLLIDGDRMRRCYSLVGDPRIRDRYEICVKKDANGRGGSQWIHTNLKVGDVIQSRYPENIFALSESANRTVLVAEGIGVAPFLSMTHRLRRIDAEFVLHYVQDLSGCDAFVDELRSICGERLKISAYGAQTATGDSLPEVLQTDVQDSHLYLSGSSRFIHEVKGLIAHWPSENVHTLYFDSNVSSPSPGHGFNVSLARQQKTTRVDSNSSVLDALQKAGLPVDYACEEGLCGACQVKVLHGKVEHRDFVLTSAQKAKNNIMVTCVSRAAAGETRLILDI